MTDSSSAFPFKPAWWLPGPHLQTLWPTLARRAVKVALTRERIELMDGDFIDLDWSADNRGPIVIILHGLEGSAESPYARGMLRMLTQHGWRGVVMHFRGCSGEPNRLPRAYHSGETEDIAAVIQHLHARAPHTPLIALGFSLGGNVLLKWLGESGAQNPLSAAVAVSVPLDLAGSSKRLQTGFSRVYQWHLLKSLRGKMREKNFSDLTKLRTIEEFDDKFTAPMHGFASAAEYYFKSSSRQFLKKISVPTLLIQSKDDPFLTPEMLPDLSELSASVTLEVTERGGHVGFVEGNLPWRPQYWLERRIREFLTDGLARRRRPADKPRDDG
jgi:predicted alpha/beta-fold hydrolase